MNEPKIPINFPSIQVARVIGYDAEQNSVLIELPSGQSPALFARMLYRGNADQYRIEQEPLPLVGTWGVVAFPGNDDRFPIWLGAYYPNITNAITSSPVLQDSQIKYFSHWSGYYSKLDGQGNIYIRLPEGTNFIANPNNSIPVTFRHVFDANATDDPKYPQSRIELPDSERVPTPPPVFWLSIHHPSGALTSCSPNGLITWQAGGPQLPSWTITPSGVATLQTGAPGGAGVQEGPTMVLDAQKGLVTVTGANKYSSIVMDVSGQVTATAANSVSQIIMDKDGNITVGSLTNKIIVQAYGRVDVISQNSTVNILAEGGDVNIGSSTHPTESLNTIVNQFNVHQHSGVTSGSADSGPPTVPLP